MTISSLIFESESESPSVMSDSLRPHGLYKSMEFSRQEYCSGQPFPSAGDLPNLEIKPKSPTSQVDSLPDLYLNPFLNAFNRKEGYTFTYITFLQAPGNLFLHWYLSDTVSKMVIQSIFVRGYIKEKDNQSLQNTLYLIIYCSVVFHNFLQFHFHASFMLRVCLFFK